MHLIPLSRLPLAPQLWGWTPNIAGTGRSGVWCPRFTVFEGNHMYGITLSSSPGFRSLGVPLKTGLTPDCMAQGHTSRSVPIVSAAEELNRVRSAGSLPRWRAAKHAKAWTPNAASPSTGCILNFSCGSAALGDCLCARDIAGHGSPSTTESPQSALVSSPAGARRSVTPSPLQPLNSGSDFSTLKRAARFA